MFIQFIPILYTDEHKRFCTTSQNGIQISSNMYSSTMHKYVLYLYMVLWYVYLGCHSRKVQWTW